MEQILERIAVALERIARAVEDSSDYGDDDEFNMVPSEMPEVPEQIIKLAKDNPSAPTVLSEVVPANAESTPKVVEKKTPKKPTVPPVVSAEPVEPAEQPIEPKDTPLDADTVVNAALAYYSRDSQGMIDMMHSVGWEKAKGKATDYIRNNPSCWERVYKGSVA